jgi:hypothetical protein
MFLLSVQPLPQQSQLLQDLTSAQIFFPIALILIGGLLMSFGFKAYRWIVLLNFVGLGWWLGSQLYVIFLNNETAERGSDDLAIVASVAGAVLMGVIAWPLLKWSVAACGGLVGFAIGMVVWAYCGQPVNMAWAGGLVGLVVLGMLSFVLFKTTVILFTSIEGAALFVLGTCALLMRYAPWEKQVASSVSKPILIPMVITTIAAISLFWQHQQHGLIGHDGAPAAGSKPGSSGGDAKKK